MKPHVINVVDAIIQYTGSCDRFTGKYAVIERAKAPLGFALPGGKLEPRETLEEALVREVREETGLTLRTYRQFGTYSAVARDPRFRAISTVYIVEAEGTPRAGSDAKQLYWFTREELLQCCYAFDHKTILSDYLNATETRALTDSSMNTKWQNRNEKNR